MNYGFFVVYLNWKKNVVFFIFKFLLVFVMMGGEEVDVG